MLFNFKEIAAWRMGDGLTKSYLRQQIIIYVYLGKDIQRNFERDDDLLRYKDHRSTF